MPFSDCEGEYDRRGAGPKTLPSDEQVECAWQEGGLLRSNILLSFEREATTFSLRSGIC
jgi:hypothetical protein